MLEIKYNSRTPRGKVDYIERYADGDIVVVCTPGHGGIKLAPKYNNMIPKVLRCTRYEEDCEANIPYFYHREILSANKSDERKKEFTKEFFKENIKIWMPYEATQVRGEFEMTERQQRKYNEAEQREQKKQIEKENQKDMQKIYDGCTIIFDRPVRYGGGAVIEKGKIKFYGKKKRLSRDGYSYNFIVPSKKKLQLIGYSVE